MNSSTGENHTKRGIFEIYDALAEAEQMGVPYRSRLDPPASPLLSRPQEVGL